MICSQICGQIDSVKEAGLKGQTQTKAIVTLPALKATGVVFSCWMKVSVCSSDEIVKEGSNPTALEYQFGRDLNPPEQESTFSSQLLAANYNFCIFLMGGELCFLSHPQNSAVIGIDRKAYQRIQQVVKNRTYNESNRYFCK